MHIVLNPFKDDTYKNTVETCFTYLIELFGRGSQVYFRKSKYIGFGRYDYEYYLVKNELVEIDKLSDKTTIVGNVTQFVNIEYVSKSIKVFQRKKSIIDNNRRFVQNGLDGLYTTNKTFVCNQTSAESLEEATNLYGEGEFDNGNLLFSLKHNLVLSEINDYISKWNEILLTYSFAIKTGLSEDSPCIFINVASEYTEMLDTEAGYQNKITEKLSYLQKHKLVVEKLLDTELFADYHIEIDSIINYLEQNGISIIGYMSVVRSSKSGSLPVLVQLIECDSISSLVEINNGHQVYI